MNSQQMSLLFILGVAAMCSAHISGLAQSQDQVYCGRTLARALALLCFDEMSSIKRSDSGMYTMTNAVMPSPFNKESNMHMDWPWMVPYKARGMAGQRGKRQLVVSECCDKPCSINELLTYC